MQKNLCYLLLLLSTFFSVPVFASATNWSSPIGKWITIDRKTQKPTGIVEITEHQGSLNGKITDGFGVDPIVFCNKCSGKLKNARVIGLTFLWGFLPHGVGRWTDGHILNPHDGKIYRGSISLINEGKQLQLRGYWGIFYRTETWVRSS